MASTVRMVSRMSSEEPDYEEVEENGVTLHEFQTEVYEDLFLDRLHRFVVCMCSRGWGKSYVAAVAAMTAVYELLELHLCVPNKIVYIIAPTFTDCTEIYFPLLNFDLGLEHITTKPASRDTGRFFFAKNVELRLLSYESVERMRGKGAYFVVWDEISLCTKGITPKEAWEGVIRPAISTRWSPARARAAKAKSAGRALFIGTTKGYNFLYELGNMHEKNPDWTTFKYDYRQSPYLDPIEIEALRHEMDPITFANEYLASPEESGNKVFYCFDRKLNVMKLDPFQLPKNGYKLHDDGSKDMEASYSDEECGEDVHACVDFNVGIMATSIFAHRGGQMQFLDEMMGHPDTEMLAIALATKYKGHKIYAYPDPTGKSRKTSATVGKTDFAILAAHGITVCVKSASPPIIASVAAVNKMLKTAAGDVSMIFDPFCNKTIQSVERTKWLDNNQDTATIDKKEGIEHFSDGIRYSAEYLHPIVSHTLRVKRGFNF